MPTKIRLYHLSRTVRVQYLSRISSYEKALNDATSGYWEDYDSREDFPDWESAVAALRSSSSVAYDDGLHAFVAHWCEVEEWETDEDGEYVETIRNLTDAFPTEVGSSTEVFRFDPIRAEYVFDRVRDI